MVVTVGDGGCNGEVTGLEGELCEDDADACESLRLPVLSELEEIGEELKEDIPGGAGSAARSVPKVTGGAEEGGGTGSGWREMGDEAGLELGDDVGRDIEGIREARVRLSSNSTCLDRYTLCVLGSKHRYAC